MNFRLAVRSLRRSPWHSATVVGTIALSVALAATVFAVVDGVLFKPLPFAAPEQLFHVQGSAGPATGTASLSAGDIRYLREADPRISVAGYGGGQTLTHPDRPDVTIWTAGVDEHFFDVLGQQPLFGGFTAAHFQQPLTDGVRPVLVTFRFWRERLGADRSIVGRTVDMVGTRLSIAGVLPRDFVYPSAQGRARPDVLLPLVVTPEAALNRWRRSFNAIVRLDQRIAFDEAQARLDAALAARVGEYPAEEITPGPYVAVRMRPLEGYLGANERRLFRVAFAGAALLLVLGAVTVAGQLTARGHDRQRELGIRVAVGARRCDLVILMMIEAMLTALAGSIVGLLAAPPLLAVAVSLLPDSLLLLKTPRIDWRVVVFGIASALVVVGGFALAPAWAAACRAPGEQLSGGRASTLRLRSWRGSALLAVESALGMCLVVAGSLTLASFVILRGEDAGLDAQRLAVIEVLTPNARDAADIAARRSAVLERLQRAPGISGVATIGVPVLQASVSGSQFSVPPGGTARFFASDIPVAGPFFEIAGLRLIAGRVLAQSELESGQPLAVVSEATARAYWPNGAAVGQTLAGRTRSVTIAGVVEDARFAAQNDTQIGEIYLPARLVARSYGPVYLVQAQTSPDDAVRRAAIDVVRDLPGILVRRAESLDSALRNSVRADLFRSVLFGASAGAGLLLLAVGVGGLVATAVARRRREIGIRSALGAQRGQLVRMVVAEHLRPALAGVALGLIASWWTTQLLSAYLYEIDAREPFVWLAATVCLLLVATLAAWIPARRAGAVDPITLLKTD